MKRVRLLWQLYPTYVLITLVAMLAVSGYINKALRYFYSQQLIHEMHDRAVLIEALITPNFDPDQPQTILPLLDEINTKTGDPIAIHLPNGERITTSNDPYQTPNHRTGSSDQFAQIALASDTSTSLSPLTFQNIIHFTTPIIQSDVVVGHIHLPLTPPSTGDAFNFILREIIIGVIIIALIAAALSWYIANKISLPLQAIRQSAQAFAKGEFGHRLHANHNEEISSLAEAMNQMAAQLDERFRTIRQQRNEQEAILSSMVEGVIAVDCEERIISMNHAAQSLFNVQHSRYAGRAIQEIIRNTDLHHFVSRTLNSATAVEGEIVILDQHDHFLQAHGTFLQDAEQHNIGAVIVLNDVTKLRHLENIRREFVANVSHELKTPITSIKGFVETLLDGVHSSEPAMPNMDLIRFLIIISRQTERLNNIIDDLLNLSRIEQDTDQGNIELINTSLHELINTVIECCLNKAKQKSISLSNTCPNNLYTWLNSQLIEQALLNLVDNAIKYSDNSSEINIHAEDRSSHTVIKVSDQGPGIAPSHIERVFERFYRIDKARSRQVGGTGLGLAIVKHIAQAHGGFVEVKSTVGVGSTFMIHLPNRPNLA